MINEDEIIILLESKEYYQVKNYINELIHNNHFINRIIKVANPFVFDRFIKMCEYKIDTQELYERRNKLIEKIILNLNDEDNIPNKWITEYITSYFFQDNYYNFMANYYQMNNYQLQTNKRLISSNNIKIYNKFKELDNASLQEKVNLFKEYYNSNIMELFYDDMNTLKSDSHKELVDAVIGLNHNSLIYKKELSKKFGIDLYYLNGEEFFGFVRCLSLRRDNLSNKREYVFSEKKRLGYSFSYFGDKNIGTSDYDSKSVALFYDNIDYRNIMYVHHADLHSRKVREQDTYLSEKENEIVTPSSLIARTNNYNEVYIKVGDGGIKPKALICYDIITNDDISFANKYGLAILLINTDKYRRFETYEEDYIKNTYMI